MFIGKFFIGNSKYNNFWLSLRIRRRRILSLTGLKGLTFIEVLIAIVIAAIVISGMYSGLNFATRYVRSSANKTMAINYAQARMENLRDVPYGNLAIGETTDPGPFLLYQGGGVNIQAQRNVSVTNYTIGTDTYKNVSVTVSWNWQGVAYTEQINTFRSNY